MDQHSQNIPSKVELIWIFISSSALISCFLAFASILAYRSPAWGLNQLSWWPQLLLVVPFALMAGVLLSFTRLSFPTKEDFTFWLFKLILPINKGALWVVPIVTLASLGIYQLSQLGPTKTDQKIDTASQKWCEANIYNEALDVYRQRQSDARFHAELAE